MNPLISTYASPSLTSRRDQRCRLRGIVIRKYPARDGRLFGPDTNSLWLLTRDPESSRRVRLAPTTETDSKFVSPCGNNRYKNRPKESRYEESSSRGARFPVAELPYPPVNAKRREFPLSAFSFLSPVCQGLALYAGQAESSLPDPKESPPPPPPRLRSAPRKSEFELSLSLVDNPRAVNRRLRCAVLSGIVQAGFRMSAKRSR